jgi:hypothetical protein
MANYEDENHQFSTILSIDDSGVWLENDLWGNFFTKRFDGSIDWDGAWRKSLKPGDVIPVLRQKRGNTYAYMTGFDLHKAEEKLRNFIDQKEQDAVVTSVIHIQASTYTQIQAYSPVWEQIYYEPYGMMIDVQRGDIVTFSRTKDEQGHYKYRLIENKTVEKIKEQGIAQILKDFNKADRDRLLSLIQNIRLGLEK